jgi:hypothetical protein
MTTNIICIDTDKLERIMAAIKDAYDCEQDDGDDANALLMAAIELDVPDATPDEINAAMQLYVERQGAEIFATWKEEKRAAGIDAPDSELTWEKCMWELLLDPWPPKTT